MNRFEKARLSHRLNGGVISMAVFLAVLMIFWLGVNNISHMTQRQEAEGLENTVRQCAVHCYALEGFYPDRLEYLEEHYGLVYDKDKYIISYEPIGSNLMPDIWVFRLGKEADRP